MALYLAPEDAQITVTLTITGEYLNKLATDMYNYKLLKQFIPEEEPFHKLVEMFFLELLKTNQLSGFRASFQ